MRALIVGAGIGGLAVGIALKRIGVDVSVFEQANDIQEVGAGLSLWTNAIHALGELGLAGALQSVSLDNPPVGLRSWDGRRLTPELPPDMAARLRGLCVILHRAELLALLLDALGKEHVTLHARVLSFSQTNDRATVRFEDGRETDGDLVIGADGLNSVVRAGLHGARPPSYSGYTAWRSVVSFDTSRAQAWESWGHGKRFGQVPMNGRAYWYATLNTPEGGRNADEKAALLETFRGWHPPIETLIEATPERAILRNDIYDRPLLATWGSGRVTLVGDAAHPMTPNLGQGACQAIEDAVVLAKCLDQERDISTALRTYEARRIPRVNPIVIESRRVGRFGQWEHPLAVRLRTALLKMARPRLQIGHLERIVRYRV
jgi:2-polyprenyl-6-methoxyphenol hydroxylase-like FAD-dependent oxidoreductase